MNKFILALAVAGFIGAGTTVPVYACEGGKCTKEHTQKDSSKAKKGKKAVKEESCHMSTDSADKATGKTMSCCMKKDSAKTETTKETKEKTTQR